jgi:ABC-2 type transport system ATP-binding protein
LIRVENLTKTFAGVPAIDGLSFEVHAGEIVGLLGPNGAGKSTTMRVLTGYLPPTAGRAFVAGFDVETSPAEARKSLGYLPESVPLYPEMRVEEYLAFRARLKGVKSLKAELDRVSERAFLTERRSQVIGTLSKGYRQRVGLADALLGRPKILILDEPTEGLDPVQIRSTRELILGLAKDHTVLLSTHILPEVEQLCQRVLLLSRGRLAADLRRDEAGSGAAGAGWREAAGAASEVAYAAAFEAPPADLQARLAALPEVAAVEDRGGGLFRLAAREGAEVSDAVVALAAREGLKLRELRRERRSVEELFVALTARESAA